MPDATTIIVIDDHPLYRSGVVRTLSEAEGLLVLGEGGSTREALDLAERVKPQIMLLDISMPGNGIEAARQITERFPGSHCVMLTASEEEEDILEALAAGARGYVLKGVGAHDLISVVRTVAEGGSYVSPSLAARLLLNMRARENKAEETSPLTSLSEREEQILRLVAEGKSNKEVGRALDLQEKTVKHYMTNILQKLQVRNRTEAAIIARENWKSQ
ncbi:MAG: response regulator transcription factor [Notoacmeibacter sp.]|nr:response regulator transcription factor [Notoacmeibacter sp.]